MEIASACDVRIASTTARFGIPAARLGIVITRPDVARLVRIAGASVAYDLLLTARSMSATEALQHGIVSAVHPPSSSPARPRCSQGASPGSHLTRSRR